MTSNVIKKFLPNKKLLHGELYFLRDRKLSRLKTLTYKSSSRHATFCGIRLKLCNKMAKEDKEMSPCDHLNGRLLTQGTIGSRLQQLSDWPLKDNLLSF